MRVSELVGVRAADLHLDEHYLTCIGKGNKERLVPIGEQATRLDPDGTSATARPRAARRAAPSPRLFVNARGGPLSRVGFWKILKGYGRARPACRARSARTSCGIRSRRTCSSAAPTCARSR